MKRAIVIIPTYNERENVSRVVPRLVDVFKSIKDWDMKVLIVDDTSPDKTYEKVKELQKKYKQLELVMNKRKAGLGGAYLKGMDHAFDTLKADAVFEFDADLSHDPTKIPLFLKEIEKGYDLVLGSRYIPGGGIPEDWGWHRKFLSRFGNFVIRTVMLNFSIKDWTSGYRAITKKLYQSVSPHMRSERFSGYTFQIGFLITSLQQGFKVSESIPYIFVDRTEGQSKLGPEYIKNTLLYIFRVRARLMLKNRIFKFLVVGAIGALTQLITLQLWRLFLPFQLAFFMAIETAVLSNFILNNMWTFSDRRLTLPQAPKKFLQFNLASSGSIFIQQIVALIGEFTIGIRTLFIIPIVGVAFDTGTLFAIIGILVGLFWNFFAYNRFIWKK